MWIILLYTSLHAQNLRTNPVAWVIGPNLRLDAQVAHAWTIGVTATHTDREINAVKVSGSSAGVVLGCDFYGAFKDSWFIDLGSAYGDYTVSAVNPSGTTTDKKLHNINTRLILGYAWFWEAFNIALGAGVETNSSGGGTLNDENGNPTAKIPIPTTGLGTEAALGWVF